MQILEVVSYYLYEGHRCAGGRGRRQKSVLPVQAGDPGIILYKPGADKKRAWLLT